MIISNVMLPAYSGETCSHRVDGLSGRGEKHVIRWEHINLIRHRRTFVHQHTRTTQQIKLLQLNQRYFN